MNQYLISNLKTSSSWSLPSWSEMKKDKRHCGSYILMPPTHKIIVAEICLDFMDFLTICSEKQIYSKLQSIPLLFFLLQLRNLKLVVYQNSRERNFFLCYLIICAPKLLLQVSWTGQKIIQSIYAQRLKKIRLNKWSPELRKGHLKTSENITS